MSKAGKAVAWMYGLQLFFVVPLLLGEIYRSEISLWPWVEFDRHIQRHGLGNALLGLYFYGLFYSSLVVVPYVSMGLYLAGRYDIPQGSSQVERTLMALWFAATFLLFSEAIFAFVRSIPFRDNIWDFALLLLWTGFTVFTVFAWRQVKESIK